MADLPTALREAFEAFWLAVPKRHADRPGKARAAFALAVKRGADPQALVRAAGRYAADCRARGVGPEWVPLVGRWLAEAGYETYPDPPAPAEPVVDRTASQDPLGDLFTSAGIDPAVQMAWLLKAGYLVEDGTLIVTGGRFLVDTIRDRHEPGLKRAFGVPRVVYRHPQPGG